MSIRTWMFKAVNIMKHVFFYNCHILKQLYVLFSENSTYSCTFVLTVHFCVSKYNSETAIFCSKTLVKFYIL